MSFFGRKMVWKDFAGIFPGQQLSGQLGRKEVRQSLCVHCVPVCLGVHGAAGPSLDSSSCGRQEKETESKRSSTGELPLLFCSSKT